MHLSKISLALRQWGAGGGFSPLSLFSSGEQGAWYDPSDLSTMFQDAEGTTPVTAVGQPVGLILDKSKGLVLGPELVTNGSFDVGTGWTLSNATISGGKLVCNSSGSEFMATQPVAFSYPKSYELDVVVSDLVSGNCTIVFGVGVNVSAPAIVSNGTYKFIIASGSGNSELRIVSSGSGFVGNIDFISIKELPGNHASQATAAKRPLLQNDGVNNYLAFDGVDDSLATANIDFTSTDKMSVFSGIVTSDNVGFDGFLQFGSVASGGVWSYFNGSTLEVKAQGSSGVSAINSVYSPSTNSVMSALINLGGATGADCLTTRKNSSFFASSSVVAGAVNFQNGVLQIANATGIFLTGRIYSLIVLGRLATTQETTDTEQWVANKTGVTLP